MLYWRLIAALVIAFSLALLAGCGSSAPKRYKVSGTVKYKDSPIPLGTITFLTEDAGAAAGGAEIKSGAYEIPAGSGLAAGKYKVSVSFPDPKGAAPAPKEGEAPGVSREVKEFLPAKYNRETELRAEVKAGEPNEISFDLK
jgi:hypothetical protein